MCVCFRCDIYIYSGLDMLKAVKMYMSYKRNPV